MGRKRNFRSITFLPVINEGEKLTEETKQWLMSNRKKEVKKNGNKR